MKAVMLSIKPKFCELIVNGSKTVEVRKTKPKLTPPFKCYIYCTTGNYRGKFLHTSEKHGQLRSWCNPDDMMITVQPDDYEYMAYTCRGKVIGEFVCDEIEKYETEFYQDDYDVFEGIYINIYDKDLDDEVSYVATSNEQANPDDCYLCKSTCLSFDDIKCYIGDGDNEFYTWHISELKIYDKPKKLREFQRAPATDQCGWGECDLCKYGKFDEADGWTCGNIIAHPPRSWCYVEEVNE